MIKIKLYDILATWFYSGYLKPASGTWGTLAALPLCLGVVYSFGLSGIITTTCVLFALGLWAAHRYEIETGEHDSSPIVIDEAAGMMVACVPLLCAYNIQTIILCVVFFRLFDAIKIGPVGWLDRHINGAWGVMIDDIAAGLMAAIIVLGLMVWMN